MISNEDGKKLVRLARETIEGYFSDSSPSTEAVEHLNTEQGVFVTLHKRGNLRGCIGQPTPVMPLYKAVMESAKNAAFEDPRFPPLQREELGELHVEVSVLTVPEIIEANSVDEYKQKIEIGRHGLILQHPAGSGLLLPQVPEEQGWSCEQYLQHICLKAGAPEDALKDENTKLYCFEAQVFSE